MAVSATADSLSIFQVGMNPEGELPIRVIRQSIAIPDDLTWHALSFPSRPERTAVIILILLAAGGLFGWLVWVYKYRVVVTLVTHRNELRIKRCIIESREVLPPNATDLLAHLAKHAPQTPLSRTELEKPFAERAYNLDTLKTLTNRAVNTLNELGQAEFGQDMVSRSPSKDDKRRQEYSLTIPISVR